MKQLNKLPHFRLHIDGILLRADEEPEVTTYTSSIKSLGYAADADSILILTGSNGYLRIRGKDINAMIQELQYIAEDMKRRKQCR